MTEMKPKSILKRTARPKKGIVWDEASLEITEAGKDSVMKITEPKTPFITYNPDSDSISGVSYGMPPLELEVTGNQLDDLADRLNMKEWESDDDIHPKKQRFEDTRAQHYDMRMGGNPLARGRELVENEEVDVTFNDPNAHEPIEVQTPTTATEADDSD